ncbi:HAD family hydrolase [Streptomonospora sp. PA3]|uniref:HAD family hydrolase n=1 Tax=Streptomonospora sp. PA3 TaxID=2607326 RepID=UPI0012DD60F6|nr:HAD family hydrolase [Streptomonospora sp. PA3]MUL40615.1 HAD family hydrolase [Streptomonospora sp. PA3]
MATPRAVVFDWRGTLAVTLTEQEWAAAALRRAGRTPSPAAVAEATARLQSAPEPQRLEAEGLDTDAALHRRVYRRILAEAGFDEELAAALYAAESDPALNPFALDAAPCLRALSARGVAVGVLSDIHVDIRPAFAAAGLEDCIDAFVLSFEHGMQKPDPRIFRLAARELGVAPHEALMVGDRAGHDGRAVEAGMPALLLPPLRSVQDRRLHLVEALLSAPA